MACLKSIEVFTDKAVLNIEQCFGCWDCVVRSDVTHDIGSNILINTKYMESILIGII